MSPYDGCQGFTTGARQRKDMIARLTFITHAATEAQRHAAFPLDELITGREQARLARLGRNIPKAEQIWSAPEQRTQQTSRILGLPVTISEGLRDCDYGRWRGRKMEEVQSEDPEGFLAWLTVPSSAPHGGESIECLIGRVGRWMDEQSAIKHTIAITHPAVIRAAIVYALRLPSQSFWRFDIAPATLTDLRFNRDVWTVRCSGCSLPATGQAEEEEADI
jgi:broad specificity phosphatase PhoE